MERIFQTYNGRIKAWVKYKVMPDKSTRIIEVKKRESKIPYSNVPIK